MELLDPKTDITFLLKPKINVKELNIMNTKKVYANLFEINVTKKLIMYQYPFSVVPAIETGDIRIRQKLFKACSKELRKIYGECFLSGDSLFGTKEYENSYIVKASLYLKGKTEYTLTFQKLAKKIEINKDEIHQNPLAKQFIEMIIKDILHCNPKLEFYKGLFVLTKSKKVKSDRFSVNFHPGFATSFMETESGNYLNVTIKNKLIQTQSILDYINYFESNQKVKEELIGRSFKVSYAKRNYIIDDIIFDRNPLTQVFNYEGETINLVKYYEKAHKLKIRDTKQPLIIVRRKGPQNEDITLYFVPELCFLAGLDDDAVKDGFFMRELAKYTKLEPNDRVDKTNEFLKLLVDDEIEPQKKDETDEEYYQKKSAKQKSEFYGIEVKPLDKLFTAYYMNETKLFAGNNKSITSKDKTFPIYKKVDMTSWLCFYEKSNYSDAENLYNTLKTASKKFGLNIEEPEWIEMPNKSKAKDWTDTADDYIGKGKKDYKFAVFLIGRNDYIYPQLKKHSLCKSGYVSQVVKAKSIQKRGALSVCSKILLQINAKLRGISYITEIDDNIKNKNLMVIGVDSSHIKGKRTGVAMVASINDTFTDFFNKIDIIEEKNKERLQYCVSSFIREAVVQYNKNNKKKNPGGIVIYRQGVSLQQKEYLKTEIKEITVECQKLNIKFYYILVNTKTTFKFFEKAGKQYNNPGPGLLIIDGVTNRNFFEFYIQPQEVTQGSATPTCFHVAYGDLKMENLIPKFTYDLCHIYSNWQGTVRIPNVIKAAEKLSKMTAKYTVGELNPELKLGQSYL